MKAQRVTSRQAPVGKVGQASHKSKIGIEVERANRKYLDKGFGREQIGPRIRDRAEVEDTSRGWVGRAKAEPLLPQGCLPGKARGSLLRTR